MLATNTNSKKTAAKKTNKVASKKNVTSKLVKKNIMKTVCTPVNPPVRQNFYLNDLEVRNYGRDASFRLKNMIKSNFNPGMVLLKVIMVDEKPVVFDGKTLYTALKELGYSSPIPCDVYDMTPEQAHHFYLWQQRLARETNTYDKFMFEFECGDATAVATMQTVKNKHFYIGRVAKKDTFSCVEHLRALQSKGKLDDVLKVIDAVRIKGVIPKERCHVNFVNFVATSLDEHPNMDLNAFINQINTNDQLENCVIINTNEYNKNTNNTKRAFIKGLYNEDPVVKSTKNFW